MEGDLAVESGTAGPVLALSPTNCESLDKLYQPSEL